MNLLIGDSHISCLKKYDKRYNNILHVFGGASIRGLVNRTSNSGAGNIVRSIIHSKLQSQWLSCFCRNCYHWPPTGSYHVKTLQCVTEDPPVQDRQSMNCEPDERPLQTLNTRTLRSQYLLNKTNNNLFIMFGKVDIEWVYPYKCREHPIDFNKFINDTIDKYIEFINEISSNFNTIHVMGIHVPSLEEADMLKCINEYNAVKDIASKSCMEENTNFVRSIGSLQTRTEQTLYFNKTLKERIMNIPNHVYIDINDKLLDTTTHTCKKEFIVDNDSHLIENKVGDVWFNTHLKSLF